MTALFVTGTGTGVGKTLVTCLLIGEFKAAGRPVRALKPVISGYTDEAAAESDSGLILAALGEPVTEATVAAVSPWRFQAPISPDMAAAREGLSLDPDAIARFCRAHVPGPDDDTVLLVEGVGGVMSPIAHAETVREVMAALGLPVLLVAGSYLGTLSHTLTASEALAAKRIPLSGIVVSESEQSPVPLMETVDALERFLAPVPVVGLPRLGAGDTAPPSLARLLGLA